MTAGRSVWVVERFGNGQWVPLGMALTREWAENELMPPLSQVPPGVEYRIVEYRRVSKGPTDGE